MYIRKLIRKYFKKPKIQQQSKNIKINENILEIIVNTPLYELKNDKIKLIEIFSYIKTFKKIELKFNELDQAFIQIKQINQWEETNYINIFKIIKNCNLFMDFEEYFKEFEEYFSSQSTETKFHIDDYIINTTEISQKIIIKTIFKIEIEPEKLNYESKKLLKKILNEKSQ